MTQATSRQMDTGMQQCIEECQTCHSVCLATVPHCLQMGSQHAEPRHIGLLLDCAEICQTSANFMLRGSDLHMRTCAVCAEVCEQCAQDCERMVTTHKCAPAPMPVVAAPTPAGGWRPWPHRTCSKQATVSQSPKGRGTVVWEGEEVRALRSASHVVRWQSHDKVCALPWLAVDLDRAAMLVDDLLHDTEA